MLLNISVKACHRTLTTRRSLTVARGMDSSETLFWTLRNVREHRAALLIQSSASATSVTSRFQAMTHRKAGRTRWFHRTIYHEGTVRGWERGAHGGPSCWCVRANEMDSRSTASNRNERCSCRTAWARRKRSPSRGRTGATSFASEGYSESEPLLLACYDTWPGPSTGTQRCSRLRL
ncbi:hypothetical protein GY45DRAFT_1071623 [Cubamyces sp. BRFM 1775]|nr:hypothetical protein GY45DRAFT_1071623 [Cubamyces sp. BRFM 1775]